jgi:3-hydroxybutyryl-CoA dehydrogenase
MMVQKICICGAGTMGSGIAQVAAQGGFQVILFDVKEAVLHKAKDNIQKNLFVLLEKGKINEPEKEKIFKSIKFTGSLNDCIADVVIEAIIEKTEAKVELFNALASLNDPGTIFASNTSSLSISSIQQKVTGPRRVVGMHFFNPAYIMKLVEVVKGEQTDDKIAESIYDLCLSLGKVPVMCKDAPGFIVNRVARHYYLESMKMVEEGIATVENVDAIMEASGFKMGPFKLMDLIGMDINLSVSQSIYDAFDHEERFKPSPLQIDKVKDGNLGRKTGKGFYEY